MFRPAGGAAISAVGDHKSPPSAAMWLLLAMAPWQHQMGRMSPASIAYLGDAVLELHARQHVLWPPADIGTHNNAVRRIVCATGQYETLKRLRAEFELTEEEEEWLRRGRNASGRGPRSVSAQASPPSARVVCGCA